MKSSDALLTTGYSTCGVPGARVHRDRRHTMMVKQQIMSQFTSHYRHKSTSENEINLLLSLRRCAIRSTRFSFSSDSQIPIRKSNFSTRQRLLLNCNLVFLYTWILPNGRTNTGITSKYMLYNNL